MAKTEEEKLKEFKKEILEKEIVPEGWEVISVENLLKTDIPKVEFLVEGLIPTSAITILSGFAGCGKSWLLLEIARCVGAEQKLFDQFDVKSGRVLYIDEESNLSEIKRRTEIMNFGYMPLVDFKSMQGFKISDEEERKKLLDLCDWRGYRLVIFDSLRDCHTYNENDSVFAQLLMDHFKELTRKGTTILISHHNRKMRFLDPKEPQEILRGSTVFSTGIDGLIAVQKTKEVENRIEMLIVPAKLRQAKRLQPFKVNLIEEDGKMSFGYIGEVEDEATRLEKTRNAIIELLREHGELYGKAIKNTLIGAGYGTRTIDRGLKELDEEGRFERRPAERNRIYLRLKGE